MKSPIRTVLIPAIGILFMTLYMCDLSYQSSVRGLDLSWHAMLAHARVQGLQHGVDLIFNYGPLSFIESVLYVEQTHRERMWLRAVYFLILGVGFFAVLRITTLRALCAWCVLTMCLLRLRDVYLLLPALLLCHHEIHRQRGNAAQLALSMLLAFDVAFACLVKSTALFFAVPALALASLYRIGIRDYRPTVPVCFALSALFLFWWSGQDLANVVPFLRGYVDASHAHNEDMGLPASLALQAAFVAGVAVVVSTLRRRGEGWIVLGLLTLGYLLVAYKMGFMRHGDHPEAAFLALALVGAVQLWSRDSHFANRSHRRVLGATVIAATLFVVSYLTSLQPPKADASLVEYRVRYLLDPAFREAFDAEWRRGREAALAEARAAFPFDAVEGPIDVFPFEFGLAYASGLPIASRPAFQSYFATSRYMTERNAEFLASAKAPRSVVFSVIPIDGRYAALEDPLALRAYRRYYQVDRQTPHALLLTRRAVPLTETQTCQTTELAFDQPLALPALAPGQALWAQIALEPRWIGRILGLVSGPPVLHMAVSTPAARTDFRFLREAGEAGFLLSPALVSTASAAHFFTGESRSEDRVASVALRRPAGLIDWYGARIPVRLCVVSWGPAP